MANDCAITVAGQSGNFQLNVMLPLIAVSLLESIQLLSGAAKALALKAIQGMKANEERLKRLAESNPILATMLGPVIGYDQAAEIVKQALQEEMNHYRGGKRANQPKQGKTWAAPGSAWSDPPASFCALAQQQTYFATSPCCWTSSAAGASLPSSARVPASHLGGRPLHLPSAGGPLQSTNGRVQSHPFCATAH